MRTRWSGILIAILAALPGFWSPTWADTPTRTYLVLPFEEVEDPDPARYWLREAMALSIGDYLVAAGQKVVDRGDRLLAMEGQGLPSGISLTLATSIRLGRILQEEGNGARPDRLIVGRFLLQEGRIETSARILDLTSNQAAPWKRYQGSLQDLLKIQESLARGLLAEEGIKDVAWNRVRDDAAAGRDFPLLAYENYVRALITLDAEERRSLLLKATQQYPGYPKASYRLGEHMFREGNSSGAAVALGRMVGDPYPYSAEYHALLGHLALEKNRVPVAEEEAAKSIAARETAEGRILLALVEQAKGNREASRREMERARELDPQHPDLESAQPSTNGDTTPAGSGTESGPAGVQSP